MTGEMRTIQDLKEAEDKMITIAMAKTKGNKAGAARLLGMSERALHRKVNKRIEKDKQA